MTDLYQAVLDDRDRLLDQIRQRDIKIAELERAIETRAAVFEADIERSASAAEAVGRTAEFAAEVATSVALAQLIANARTPNPPPATEAAAEPDPEPARKRRHHSRARDALALPFFSFAQGLRRGNRS